MATLPVDTAAERPHVPARAVLLSAAALWLTYFLLITLRGIVVDIGEFNELLWRRAVVTLAGIAVTLLAWPVLRRFDGRSNGARIGAALVIMLPAALALAAINQQCFAPVEKKMIEREAKAAQAQAEAAARAIRARQGSMPGVLPSDTPLPSVRVRHDVSGNVLIDVADPPQAIPMPPPAPEPPAPPAPPAPPRGAKFAPPPPDPGDDQESSDPGNEAAVITAPGGVSIIRRSDGTAEVRVGDRRIPTDADQADEIAAELAQAQREVAQAQREMDRASAERLSAAQARLANIDAVRWNVLRSLADAGLVSEKDVPAAPAGPVGDAVKEVRAHSAKVHKARPAKPRPVQHAAARPAAKSAPVPAPSPSPTASAAPAPAPAATDGDTQIHTAIISKMIEDEGLWKQLTDVALGRYFLLIAWAGLYIALGNAEMARASERREGEYKRAAKAAELRSLRYQVNPHFLFNTLNSLSALVMVGRTEQAEKMIQTISSFYRHSLAGDPTSDVPLVDEIALQRHYLEIEAVRFPERLVCEFDVPQGLENACVPGMILQPLVENSIKYGVSASIRPVTIRIAAQEAGGKLVLTVTDDGPGKGGASGSTGIGLENVRNRLAARFGDEARVESGALPAGGYATVLTIPLVRSGCE
ncbi:hypothetical protein NSE01_12740 [Novosphingobium sediminis]|uniref:Uncharacterized protein n=1 Tax=Novosphingobium sediminis TaxID=707214 RepID=A0A512AIC6_9SPHN|nr:hypothetical protein NSE01_12740 [Novosphingobium sediminis]